jgi:hypothetical protein
MSEREKLASAMAKARMETQTPHRLFVADWEIQPKYVQASLVADEQISLAALCEAIPGLSDVIKGEAVIVPREATGEMLEGADDALCGVAVGDLAHDLAGDVFAAMIAANPYRRTE